MIRNMPRPKAFDPNAALQLAVETFWTHGYGKTSLPTLMRETGVARQSLYDTFGDKRALYLEALRRYRDTNHAALRRILKPGQPVREAFAKILLGIGSEPTTSLRRGCMLLSANLERVANDREVEKLLQENQAAVIAIFRSALERAQSTGEIGSAANCEALARFLVSTIQGMRAMAQVQPNRAALKQVARVALSALR
jgi:TetR/AcrR family transcriptional regulator, transcriptional repressor for nem operon